MGLNSAPAQSSDDRNRSWYIFKDGQTLGPYGPEFVLDQLKLGRVSWIDYIWTPSQDLVWRLICEVTLFRSHLPKSPATDILRKLSITSQKPESTGLSRLGGEASGPSTPPPFTGPTGRPSLWFLQLEGTEFGPMTADEARGIQKGGKLKGVLFARREGMQSALPIDNFVEFGGEPPQKSDRRQFHRINISSTTLFTGARCQDKGLPKFMGVCCDISQGGMLIKSALTPGKVGDIIGVEVQSSPTSLLPFLRAECEIMRLLEEQEAFGVRFLTMSDEDRKALDAFLQQVKRIEEE